MSQEARQKGNRAHVAELVAKVKKRLERALKEVNSIEEMVLAVHEADSIVKTADKLAKAHPAGYRALPKPIQTKTNRAIAILSRLSTEIAQYPVTKDERVLAKDRKARRKAVA